MHSNSVAGSDTISPFTETAVGRSSDLLSVIAVIIARDEAAHLGHCLDSLAWADARLVVLDPRTRDASESVAVQHGATVVRRAFTTFPAQRNAAIELVQEDRIADWLLFVDADERATPALAAEVRATIGRSADPGPVGFWIPRRNFIWGGWIRHGGWWPDPQLRLLKIGAARYDRAVHEVAVLEGEAGTLHEPLLHYNYDRLDQFCRKQQQYALLEAQHLAQQGERTKPWNLALQPARELNRRLVSARGYRDGWRGWLLAGLLAGYAAVTYIELARRKGIGFK